MEIVKLLTSLARKIQTSPVGGRGVGVQMIHRTRRVSAYLLTCVALMALALGCNTATEAAPEDNDQLSIVASIYPVGYFATRIGAGSATVRTIIPAGAEAHAFTATPSDMLDIAAANLVIMNGLGMDLWLERAVEGLGGDFTGTLLNVGAELPEAQLIQHDDDHKDDGHDDHKDDGHDDHKDDGHDDHDHGDSPWDPHIWLDPVVAKSMVGTIRDSMIEAQPSMPATFTAQAKILTDELSQLDTEFSV